MIWLFECGLAVDDVVTDNGEHPYVHITPNAFRRLKNLQSQRVLFLHPELVRLGFLDYVDALKKLKHKRLFPDLYSPSTKSPLGDRYYDEMHPLFAEAEVTTHQLRHHFGNTLKQAEVTGEIRADLLGHAGQTETTNRYCDPAEISLQRKYLLKLPNVTKHLEPRTIRLLPWVENRQISPWSRASEIKKRSRQSR